MLKKYVVSGMLDLSRLVSLEKFLANNFALSAPEDSTSMWLNKEGLADLLYWEYF